MNESKISVRYAKALFALAKETASLDQFQSDMGLLYQCIKEIPELQYVIHSPVIKTSIKIKLFKDMFDTSFNKLNMSFVNLVLDHHREEYLEGISRYFLSLIKTERGIQSAELVTAVTLDDSLRQSIIKLIMKKIGASNIELKESTNDKLIGGFVLRIGDQQIDASISTQLKRIQKELLESN